MLEDRARCPVFWHAINNVVYRDRTVSKCFPMRLFFQFIIIFLLLSPIPMILTTPLYSQEDTDETREEEKKADTRDTGNDTDASADKKRLIGFDLGMGGGYSTGISVNNFQYRLFGDIFLKHKYVKLTGGLSRWQNYLVTNGEGLFETVNFTQPKIALSIYPHRVIELYGEYRYSTGDPSHYYRGHEGTGGLYLDFDPVSIDVSVNGRMTEYLFKSENWLNKITLVYSNPTMHGGMVQYYTFNMTGIKHLYDITPTATLSWYVIDSTSIDATYYFIRSVLGSPDDVYYMHTGNIGVYSDVWKYISLHGGANIGVDGERYVIIGGDAGITFKILEYAIISVTYLPGYYIAPQNGGALGKFIELYALCALGINASSSSNPNINPSLIGKSFFSQSVTFSARYTF